jgi:thymidylate synthase ThyX
MTISPNITCIHGAEPETQAYALAKYSRSSKSIVDSLQELSRDKSSKFLDTFYFAYGHRSIADLAHIPMALEDVSMLAAIDIVDETKWDGQERSTRYQDFSKRRVYRPSGLSSEEVKLYDESIALLFETYDMVTAKVSEVLKQRHPCPPEMKSEAWERTVMARTFDISRYFLPLASLTSVGQITSARSLEGQISRLLSSPYTENQDIGNGMMEACMKPAYNPISSPKEIRHQYEFPLAPTLVKYATANPYMQETRSALADMADRLMKGSAVREVSTVDLISFGSLEDEIACSLLYEATHYPMRQIKAKVHSLSEKRLTEILDLGVKFRGSHDELLRPFKAACNFTFDIYMDIGAFRDMHRHRRCVQLFQDYNAANFDMPILPEGIGITRTLKSVFTTIRKNHEKLRIHRGGTSPNESYILPLAAKRRFVMKMDFAELAYIAELRTGQAGHIAYRQVAFDMFRLIQKAHPYLCKDLKVTDVSQPVDFFRR